MSESTLKKLVLLLAALVIVYGAASLVRGGGGPASPDGAIADAIHALHADTLTAVTITPPDGEAIALARSGEAWSVNGMAADSTAVARLERALRDAELGDLVSSSAMNHERLGVAEDSAWRVEIQSRSGDSQTLLIGKQATDSRTAYVRLPDSDETWELSGDVGGAAKRKLADWRDRILARVDTADIAGIDVRTDSAHYTLSREGKAWRIADAGAAAGAGAAVDSAAVSQLLAELIRPQATSLAADTASFTGERHRAITIRNAAGDTLAALEFAGTGYTWLARKAGDSTVYNFSSYTLDRLTPKRSAIEKKPAS